MPKDPIKQLAGSIGANVSWANTEDRAARTAAARRAADARFERQVRGEHPDWPDDQVARAAAHLRRAHLQRAALASVMARRAKGGG